MAWRGSHGNAGLRNTRRWEGEDEQEGRAGHRSRAAAEFGGGATIAWTQAIPAHLRRVVEELSHPRNDLQEQLPAVDRGRVALVRIAVVLHRRSVFAHQSHRELDGVAG